MNISEAIALLYPDADRLKDIVTKDDGNGLYIETWNESKYGPKPTSQELLKSVSNLQSQHDLSVIQRKRKREYPTVEELTVALWESVVENNDTSLNELQSLRMTIKARYPKP